MLRECPGLKLRVSASLQAAVRTRVFILEGLESAQLFPSELGVSPTNRAGTGVSRQE